MERKRICFIDDSPKEIERFIEYFGGEFKLYTGTSFEKVKERLGSVNPDLFVLDLYFPDGKVTPVTSGMFERFWKLPHISETYTDKGNELLENTWGVVVAARHLMESVLHASGQKPKGGIDLLKQVQEEYLGVPVVFYTRKGSLQDAVKCIRLGASDVIQKPHPARGETEKSEMERMRQPIIDRFDMAIKNRWFAFEDLKDKIAGYKKMEWNTKNSANKLLIELRECFVGTDKERRQKTYSELKTVLPSNGELANILSRLKPDS